MNAVYKLTLDQANEMRRLHAVDKVMPLDLAKRYNCSVPLVWKVLKGQIYTGKLASNSAQRPNVMPPSRVRDIFEAKRQKSGGSYTKQEFATDLGVSLRQVQAYMQPEGSVAYRRPGGGVRKTLLEWEWCLNNGMVNRQA